MRSESEIEEVRSMVMEEAEELEEEGKHAEAIGPAVMVKALDWVLEQADEENPLKEE